MSLMLFASSWRWDCLTLHHGVRVLLLFIYVSVLWCRGEDDGNGDAAGPSSRAGDAQQAPWEDAKAEQDVVEGQGDVAARDLGRDRRADAGGQTREVWWGLSYLDCNREFCWLNF
jgi:hypothetical protein